jgi:hypothetical protein
VDLAHLNAISMREIFERVPGMPFLQNCSPIRMRDENQSYTRGQSLKDMPNARPGTYVFRRDNVVFKPLGEALPQVELARKRKCRSFTWLYPGDVATIVVKQPGALHAGASVLLLGGYVMGEPTGTGRVILSNGDVVHLNVEIAMVDLDDGLELVLDEPMGPAPEKLTLTIETPRDGPFVILYLGVLTGGG